MHRSITCVGGSSRVQSYVIIDAKRRKRPRPHINSLLEGVVRVRLPARSGSRTTSSCKHSKSGKTLHRRSRDAHGTIGTPTPTSLCCSLCKNNIHQGQLPMHARVPACDAHFSTSPLRAWDRFQGSSADAPFSLASFWRAVSIIGRDRSCQGSCAKSCGQCRQEEHWDRMMSMVMLWVRSASRRTVCRHAYLKAVQDLE